MDKIKIGTSNIEGSRIALGCMTIGGSWDRNPISKEDEKRAIATINAALEEGINFFDHADIYCLGKSEEVFSKIWDTNPNLRENIILQSKCSIDIFSDENPSYDHSKDYILNAVDGILSRLKTDYLDILLLHRPDTLVEPEEVAEAFDILENSGKVRNFGVSNYNAMQIQLLQKFVKQPIITNQMEISLQNSSLIDQGMNVNCNVNPGYMRNDGTLEFCRLHDIILQAWSPLAGGRIIGDSVDEKYAKLNSIVGEYAEKYEVSKEAILTAWLLRHPAKIQPIIGTRSPERIKAICKAVNVELTRREWYNLYNSVDDRRLL